MKYKIIGIVMAAVMVAAAFLALPMETVEQTAKIYAWVQLLGGGEALTREQTQGLLALSGRYERLAGRREPGKED